LVFRNITPRYDQFTWLSSRSSSSGSRPRPTFGERRWRRQEEKYEKIKRVVSSVIGLVVLLVFLGGVTWAIVGYTFFNAQAETD
jgi:hypothetical protein